MWKLLLNVFPVKINIKNNFLCGFSHVWVFFFCVSSGALSDIYYSMDRYKSHRNIYFTISSFDTNETEDRKKSSHHKWKRNEKNLSYRLLTDILMSKTIQFAPVEFLIFHNPEQIKSSALFLHSYFMTYYIRIYSSSSGPFVFTRALVTAMNYWLAP